MNAALLKNLAEVCVAKGIRHAVICPGSRSAPLTLAFVRNKNLTCRIFSDERSAAFVALGMAQQTGTPVIMVCTSGSAAYNFAPAVAESYFQQIPLIVFTADRPKEWIDQYDGQTIRQAEIFGKHVKGFFELPQEFRDKDYTWHANRSLNDALNLATSGPCGPVHINVPLREPLYQSSPQAESHPGSSRTINVHTSDPTLPSDTWKSLAKSIRGFGKVLVVPGQLDKSEPLHRSLSDFTTKLLCAVAGDILSNMHSLPFFCRHADTFLGQVPDSTKQDLRPDLLITFGKSLVAKQLKMFLRNNSPGAHWHIQEAGAPADTFQSLTQVLHVSPETFFEEMNQGLQDKPGSASYAEDWLKLESKAKHAVPAYLSSAQDGEFKFLHQVMSRLPQPCNLHLANSMSVRYANHIGLNENQKEISVYSNRGTSGIDGCTSTAAGHALTSSIPNVLITGDQAFFYDRNAFWHNYTMPNLYVVVLNNHGGIIFNLIDGPGTLPEAEEFFITRQALTSRSLASEFGLKYVDSKKMETFFDRSAQASIVEFDSSQSLNKAVFQGFVKQIKKSYEA